VEEISKINQRLNGEEPESASTPIDWSIFEQFGGLE
jgi:hypothetical protein